MIRFIYSIKIAVKNKACPLIEYSTVILDCDGVILDSNSIKTAAMHDSVIHYGSSFSEEFIRYHQDNGGISRYIKYEYFLRNIVKDYSKPICDALIDTFSTIVKSKLVKADYTAGFENFLNTVSDHASIYIVSGGDQDELREVFELRGISHYFSAIFGSPISKFVHCENIRKECNANKTLLIGDSRLDHEAAQSSNFDFVFISDYSDFEEWSAYCRENNLNVYQNFNQLLLTQYSQ